MTRSQFNKAMVSMGITQIALAKAFETDERTVRRWMTGDSPVPTVVALLLNLMQSTDTKLEDLKA
jgi:DNA-binding transcriptional regulator YiaG